MVQEKLRPASVLRFLEKNASYATPLPGTDGDSPGRGEILRRRAADPVPRRFRFHARAAFLRSARRFSAAPRRPASDALAAPLHARDMRTASRRALRIDALRRPLPSRVRFAGKRRAQACAAWFARHRIQRIALSRRARSLRSAALSPPQVAEPRSRFSADRSSAVSRAQRVRFA